MRPIEFIISDTDDSLISHSGLALAGALLGRTAIAREADALTLPGKPRPFTRHSDVLLAMIGLLCLGKTDFTDIEAFREDEFFRRALGLGVVPSEPTLRQRFGEFGAQPHALLLGESAEMLARHAPVFTPCHREWVALDVDVCPFDNSNTRKEGVGRTYKKVDGYAPIFAYLGEEGYLVHAELREGTQHCQKGTPAFLKETVRLARIATDAKLLARLDAGNDAADTLTTLQSEKVDFIVKRNLRKESKDEWLTDAQALGEWLEPRDGKLVFVGDTERECGDRMWRVVFEVVERTTDSQGQMLLIPDVEIATYWTSLTARQATPDEVISLYRDHGTSEQFHSEIKSDLDLERLPSGKFSVNDLILRCGLVAYNVLRLIGQTALKEDKDLPPRERMPIRKPVKRRRLRSVIQDMMYMAGRFIRHARRWGLSLARLNPWRGAWQATCAGILANRPAGAG